MQLLRHKFKGEADRKLVDARIDPINAIPKPFQVTDVPDGALTSYFTAPERVTGYDVVPPIDDHGQWDHFVGYVKRLLQDEMKPLPTGKELEEVVLTYFVWAQRFFDAGGAISVQDGAAQTGSGPWLATAYPRTGTPAYVTPDANGRLQYDHLMGDRWAHNYRYYIRPYSRYDRLWRSFYESDKLLPPTSPATENGTPAELLEILDYRPDPDQAALDIVLDRTYPIDKPVVLRSARLDLELPGQAVTPGSTWEVIVTRHWEQNAIERNKTLERQLTFRRIWYNLVRRFAFQNHIEGLKRALDTQKADGPSYVLNPDVVSNRYPAIPSSYLPAPATTNPDTHDVNESLALALPERMNRFQEGALVIQWGRLLYYYEHKLMLVAQTTTDVSPVNAIVQRDFEYVTPKAKATATWVEEGGDFVLAVSLQLARYWDCLPPNAQKMWQIEDADKPIAEGDSDPQHLKLSALPDLEVVYLIAERYMGNLEVQHEISFQANRNGQPFQALLRAGQRFKAISGIKIAPPPAPTDHFTLHFTLRPAEGGRFEAGAVTHGPFTTEPPLPVSLQDELRFERQADATFTAIYTGFMTEEKAKALFALFADAKDRKAVQELYNRNVSVTRRGTLNIRTLRGSAQPETLAFTAPKLAAS
jgi:hypothetical protein